MKILIAIDSFKGSISAFKASEAISLGISDVLPHANIVRFPLADGGEGTVETLVQATSGQFITTEVTGPLHNPVKATYGMLGGKDKVAVIEVAAACGLPLVPVTKRNPLFTTTYGVGELIVDALEKGCREFILGLGGSATSDAGVGMLQALGFRFLDKSDQEIGLGASELRNIVSLDLQNVHPLLKESTFKVACDVDNPLYGPEGAAYIFGPQKGAAAKDVLELDKGLKHFSDVVSKQLNMEIGNLRGAGSAGGLGAAFFGLLQAELHSGFDLISEMIDLEEHIKNVDVIFTGEGQLDSQTARGKVPFGVAKLAQKYKKPVIALAGSVEQGATSLNHLGITAFFSVMNVPMSVEKAMGVDVTYQNLRITAGQLCRLIRAFN